MIKQHAILEVVKNGNTYQLHLPDNVTLGEVHDVLFEMRTFVIAKIVEAQKADQQKEKPPVEVIDG